MGMVELTTRPMFSRATGMKHKSAFSGGDRSYVQFLESRRWDGRDAPPVTQCFRRNTTGLTKLAINRIRPKLQFKKFQRQWFEAAACLVSGRSEERRVG